MRADRLLSILLLLQVHGKATTQRLAEELEVSERTIYRDVDALSGVGVPIYAERGPGGGISLLESYRTNLTGLKDDEIRALFMLSVPTPLVQLGISQELKAALVKLSAALPTTRHQEAAQIRQRIYLDPKEWYQSDEPVPHLRTIQQAVWQDRKLYIKYRLPFLVDIEQVVAPYGLVAKVNTWYLVCAREGYLRVLRVSSIVETWMLEESFERRTDFDLPAYWQSWCAGHEENRPVYPVRVRVAPELVRDLPFYFGAYIKSATNHVEARDEKGWMVLTLLFERLESARDRILSFGRAVEVLEPEALRKSIIDYAEQIVSFYTPNIARDF